MYTQAINDRIQPAAGSPRGSFLATIKENVRLCTDHYRLTLHLPWFPASVPGQFIQVDCRDPHAATAAESAAHNAEPQVFEWPAGDGSRPGPCDADFIAPMAYLRRPFSIADHRTWPDGYTELDIIHRVVGRGTLLLMQLQAGQRISILGPLGVGFGVPEGLGLACLVGGGVGIPPMIYLAKLLSQRYIHESVVFVGAQRHDLLPVTFMRSRREGDDFILVPEASSAGDPMLNVEEFGRHGFPSVITTDDGSLGMKGYVTQALRRFLEEQRIRKGTLANTMVYCCGPTPMMKATARVAEEFEVPCQVSLEQPMACGMGTCQSCVIRYRPHEGPRDVDWKYRLTCTDGPVFDSRDILW